MKCSEHTVQHEQPATSSTLPWFCVHERKKKTHIIFLSSRGADAHLYTNLSVILFTVKDWRLNRCLCCLWCARLPSTNAFCFPCRQVSCLPAALLLLNKSELAANTWSADVASCKEKNIAVGCHHTHYMFLVAFCDIDALRAVFVPKLALSVPRYAQASNEGFFLHGWCLLKYYQISVRNEAPGIGIIHAAPPSSPPFSSLLHHLFV